MNEFYVCKHCSEQAPRAELNKKGWLVCNPCLRKFQKSYREKHKEKLKALNAKYLVDNKEAIRAQRKAYRDSNKDKLKAQRKATWKKHGKKYSASHYKWKVKKLKTDVNFKLRETIRSRIAMAIKGKAKRGSAIKLLGCSIEHFKQHIESQFKAGMTWDNWSLRGWHLDHIKPIKDFDLTDLNQLAEVCHYTNLRPLWAVDNLAKRFEDY